MPANTLNAARPGLIGNPFPIDIYGRPVAVELHTQWLKQTMSTGELSGLSRCDRWSDPPGVSLVTLRRWVLDELKNARGMNLACWCALDGPCHADVLLEIANR